MRVRKVKEATSVIHEERQGADESYWAVFPVLYYYMRNFSNLIGLEQ